MKIKPVVPRELAGRDVDEAIDYYLSENAPEAALGFVDALERTYSYIARHPSAGSSRYAVELNLPGLRFWPVKRYPHLVFYLEQRDRIDIWRVLHGERDVPTWMRDPDFPAGPLRSRS